MPSVWLGERPALLIFSVFGSNSAGLLHARVRSPEARRAAPLRGALRTPANTFGRVVVRANRRTRRRAQVTRKARRRTVRPQTRAERRPRLAGRQRRMTRPRPRPARGGSVARDAGFARPRCDSTRGGSRDVVRDVRADPRRARAAPRARLRRANALRIPRRSPRSKLMAVAFFPSPLGTRRRPRLTRGRTRA